MTSESLWVGLKGCLNPMQRNEISPAYQVKASYLGMHDLAVELPAPMLQTASKPESGLNLASNPAGFRVHMESLPIPYIIVDKGVPNHCSKA